MCVLLKKSKVYWLELADDTKSNMVSSLKSKNFTQKKYSRLAILKFSDFVGLLNLLQTS